MTKHCCLICGNPSWNSKFCRECREKIHTSWAVVSQNVTKLKSLLEIRKRDTQWFERFITYSSNIVKFCK